MRLNISEISEKRLEKVLVKDKKNNPNKICELLKSDLNFLLKNYIDVADLNVNFDIINGLYQIDVKIKAHRLKNFGSLPY